MLKRCAHDSWKSTIEALFPSRKQQHGPRIAVLQLVRPECRMLTIRRGSLLFRLRAAGSTALGVPNNRPANRNMRLSSVSTENSSMLRPRHCKQNLKIFLTVKSSKGGTQF